jgi:hypothetical protein
VNYLFLGNWGDRGEYGVETVTLLLALKAAYPDRVHLLRGKHETRPITQVYGLYDDCARKYRLGVTVWTALMHVFDRLPLAAVVDDKVFCVSSGLSPELQTLAQIDDIDRFLYFAFRSSSFFVLRFSFFVFVLLLMCVSGAGRSPTRAPCVISCIRSPTSPRTLSPR